MATSYSDWVYYGSGYCALRIKWTYTDAAATCKVAATLQRWDQYAQSGQGSATISQTSNGSKTASFGSCSNNQTRDVVALGTYTYSKGTSAKTVTASVSTNDWFATITDGGYVTIGAISFSKTFTISKKTSYTVKYAANGGSSTPSSQTKWYGTALTLAAAISHANAAATAYAVALNHNYSGSSNGSLSAARTTKYAFSKWKATNGTQYAAKGSYTANSATTMTAQWTTSTTTAAVTLTTPSRTGYTFDGWATSSTGAKAYSGGASYTPSGNVTLYARWNRTVKYNANGGSGAPGDQTGVATSAMTLSSTIPTREGYRFLGWNTKADGTGTNYAAGSSYPAQNPTVTLYAKWQVLLNINVTSATRCTSNGTPDPLGSYCNVQWNWENGDGSQVEPLFTVTTTPATSTGTVEVEVPDSVGAEEVLLSGIGPQTEYTITVAGVTIGTSTATASLPKTYTAPSISSVKTNRVEETSQGSGEYRLADDGEVLKLDVAWAVCQSGNQRVNMSVQAVDTDDNALFKVNGIPTPHVLMANVAGNYGGTSTFYVDAATFLADKQYTVTVYLGDVLSNTAQRGDVLSSAYFPLDFLGDAYYYEPTEDASCDPTKTYYVMGDAGWYVKFEGSAFEAGVTYYEKTGPKPGHGVSFGAPCKDEGFHVHMPVYEYNQPSFFAPIGTVLDYAGSTVPSGYLECNGEEYLKADYPLLYAAIGDSWGVSPWAAPTDSLHFRVPNLNGRVTIGAGTGTADGATAHNFGTGGGDERMQSHNHPHTIKATTPKFTHSITQPVFALPNHRHGPYNSDGYNGILTHITDNSISQSAGFTKVTSGNREWIKYTNTGNPTSNPNCTRSTNVGVGDHAATDCTMSGSVSNSGSGSAGNMQPFATLRKIIRAV